MSDNGDERSFSDLMGDVRRLRSDKAEPDKPRPAAEARFTRADRQEVLRESLSGPAEETDSLAEVSYFRPDVPRTVMRKLRRGRYSIGSELDLHGLNARAAREALDQFLAEAVMLGHGCVRIVHGKGTRSGHRGPVLKPKVARWLRQRSHVLAYTTARPVDGGSGALYVLLKT